MQRKTKTRALNVFQRFFLFCSGTNTDLFDQIDSDYVRTVIIKQIIIGSTVFLTGIAASISGGYALYTVFDEQLLPAIVFGLFWGILIFNLDRFIVFSITADSWWRKLLQAFPRLLLALVIALVISRPLELRIFQDEIQEQLEKKRLAEIEKQADEFEMIALGNFRQDSFIYANRRNEENQLGYQLDSLAKDKHQEFLNELTGKGGSGAKGYGKISKALETEWINLKIRRDSTFEGAKKQQTLLTQLEGTLPNLLDNAREQAKNEVNSRSSTSLLARHKALWYLQSDSTDSSAFWMGILITLLFVLLETAPVLTKLLIRDGPYEALRAKYENPRVVRKIGSSYNAEAQIAIRKAQLKQLKEIEELRLNKIKEIEIENIDKAGEDLRQRLKKGREDSPAYYLKNTLGDSYSWVFTEPDDDADGNKQNVSDQPRMEESTRVKPVQKRSSSILVPLVLILVVAFFGITFMLSEEEPSVGLVTERPLGKRYSPPGLNIPSITIPVELDTTNKNNPDISVFDTTARGDLSLVRLFNFERFTDDINNGDTLTLALVIKDSLVKRIYPSAITGDQIGTQYVVKEILTGRTKLVEGDLTKNYLGQWLRVESENGKEGELFSYFTKKGHACHCREIERSLERNPFYVRDPPMFVRQEEFADSKWLAKLKYGEVFEVIDRNPELKPFQLKKGDVKYGYWCKVNANGVEGYIFDYFTFKGIDYFDCLSYYKLLPKKL